MLSCRSLGIDPWCNFLNVRIGEIRTKTTIGNNRNRPSFVVFMSKASYDLYNYWCYTYVPSLLIPTIYYNMQEFMIACDIPALRTLKCLICSITLLTEMITAAIFNFDT
jgi:hypothetical protein